MKKLVAIAISTVALLAVAIGVQAFGTSGDEGPKGSPAASTQATPPDGSTEGPRAGTTKQDDGERDGFTDEHEGKPGENK